MVTYHDICLDPSRAYKKADMFLVDNLGPTIRIFNNNDVYSSEADKTALIEYDIITTIDNTVVLLLIV